MELIAREALKSKLQKNIEELADKTGFFEGIRMGYESAVHFVEQAPTVEERKHGHWINPKAWHVECSECHHVLEIICGVKNYCPNCGAKMDGEPE
ncbi:hypothetical protein [Phascolarctobacterium faecium]|uniref:hypothetical protein n=1 Tax=Phascolarctobacterium faecium TaxID=33025 RepID=UPI003A915F70